METQDELNQADQISDGNDRDKHITVIVNGRKKEVKANHLSFHDVVSLRFDGNPPQGENWVFTVAYRKGPKQNPQGTMVKGQTVKIQDGMIFDVTATDKS